MQARSRAVTRYLWNAARRRTYARAVAVKEADTIPFPRERAGLNYALNWSIAAKAIVPSGDVFGNLKDSELAQYGASPQGAVSGSKIYARGSYSTGSTEITKAQFNKLFKEVAQHLSSCSKLFVHDGSIGASSKLGVKVRAACDNPSAASILGKTLYPSIQDEAFESPLSVYVVSNHKSKTFELPGDSPFVAADYDRSALIVSGNSFADPTALKSSLAAFAAPAILSSGALPLTCRVISIKDSHILLTGPNSIVSNSSSVFPDAEVIWNADGATSLFNTEKADFPKLLRPAALVLVTVDSSRSLPEISKLRPDQAAFHLLAGFDGESYTPLYKSGLVSLNPVSVVTELSSLLMSTKLPAFLLNASNGKSIISGKDLIKTIEKAVSGKLPKSNEQAVTTWGEKHKEAITKSFPTLPDTVKL